MRLAHSLFLAGLAGALSSTLNAHQLDECLQSSTLAVSRDRVAVDLSLTPGVVLAPAILEAIDRDRDGRLSPVELRDHAGRVMRDLTLTVDGHPRRLILIEADAAAYGELRDGLGTVRLQMTASLEPLPAGAHIVEFTNAHDPSTSAYLVNVVVPDDPAIAIRAQRRDRLQRVMAVDVEVASPTHPLAALVIFAAALGARVVSGAFRRTPPAASVPHR